MAEKQKLTPEQKAQIRDVGLKNLKADGLRNIALSFYVDSSKELGDGDNNVMEQFKYLPALNSGAEYIDPETGEEVNLVSQSLVGSRNPGKRYSGNVSEYDLMSRAGKVIDTSIASLKVSDVLGLMGSETKGVKYGDSYILDLLDGDKDQKEYAQAVMGLYRTYMIQNSLGESWTQASKSTKGGLEDIVSITPQRQAA